MNPIQIRLTGFFFPHLLKQHILFFFLLFDRCHRPRQIYLLDNKVYRDLDLDLQPHERQPQSQPPQFEEVQLEMTHPFRSELADNIKKKDMLKIIWGPSVCQTGQLNLNKLVAEVLKCITLSPSFR